VAAEAGGQLAAESASLTARLAGTGRALWALQRLAGRLGLDGAAAAASLLAAVF
jgi:hypothetical protein